MKRLFWVLADEEGDLVEIPEVKINLVTDSMIRGKKGRFPFRKRVILTSTFKITKFIHPFKNPDFAFLAMVERKETKDLVPLMEDEDTKELVNELIDQEDTEKEEFFKKVIRSLLAKYKRKINGITTFLQAFNESTNDLIDLALNAQKNQFVAFTKYLGIELKQADIDRFQKRLEMDLREEYADKIRSLPGIATPPEFTQLEPIDVTPQPSIKPPTRYLPQKTGSNQNEGVLGSVSQSAPMPQNITSEDDTIAVSAKDFLSNDEDLASFLDALDQGGEGIDMVPHKPVKRKKQ
jgi:hypothetical protein